MMRYVTMCCGETVQYTVAGHGTGYSEMLAAIASQRTSQNVVAHLEDTSCLARSCQREEWATGSEQLKSGYM